VYTLRVKTAIHAPRERCFDLARSVDAHVQSSEATGERAVAGRTAGLLELGEDVTWEGRHFGVKQRLTSRITAYRRPDFFQDRMVRGAFRHLEHDHSFESTSNGVTRMVDVVRFAAPFGPVGWLAERLVIGPHLRRFIQERGLTLKAMAESDGWRQFLSP
jgi:ligand-binding SRPBCC domain-containing protein